MTRRALIIGATGGFGGAVATALVAHGWSVGALGRRPQEAARLSHLPPGIRWIAGDALSTADVIAAAGGADVIVHAANPPGYRDWDKLAMPMLENTIAAAAATGARIVLPGNIYNFGPDAWPEIAETSPQHPVSKKGAIRVEMEAMLARAGERGVASLIVRAGDFLGAHAPGSWLNVAMVKPGRPVAKVVYPGEPTLGHAFAYLPDLAEAVAGLLGKETQLAPCDTFQFAGYFVSGAAFADAVRTAAGAPDAPVAGFPWRAVRLASPVVRLFRELLEMRYLWRTEIRLNNDKLVALLGEEPHTPLPAALRQILGELGCLADRPAVAQ